MQKFLMLILAMTAVFFISCGGDEEKTDKCSENKCSKSQECDPGSGKCIDNAINKCKDNTCAETGKVCEPTTGDCVEGTVDKCEGKVCGEGSDCNKDTGNCEAINPDNLDTIVKARKHMKTLSQEDAKAGVAITTPIEGVIIAVQKSPSAGTKYAAVMLQANATLSEGYAGIHLNLANAPTQLTIGDLVLVKGQVKEFHDRTELIPASEADLQIKTSGFNVPPALDVSSSDLEADAHKKYESMLLNITDGPFTITVVPDYKPEGIYDYTLKNSANDELTVSTSFDAKRTIKLNLDQSVTKIAGVLTYSYETLRLSPRDIKDITAGSFPCGQSTCNAGQLCNNNACMDITPEKDDDTLCSDGIDNDGNGYIDCADYGCSRSDKVTVCPGE